MRKIQTNSDRVHGLVILVLLEMAVLATLGVSLKGVLWFGFLLAVGITMLYKAEDGIRSRKK
jgi:hypothetical protein